MKLLKQFIQQETVLTAAAVLAVVSAFFVLPDAQYLGYIDLRTLAILFSLMTVMAGLRRQGFFDGLGRALLSRTHSTFQLTLVLVGLCFFGSMFITNDVSLLTFVPFTFVVLSRLGADVRCSLLIPVVCMQTIAANLGSMLTPIGNPQNLYTRSHSWPAPRYQRGGPASYPTGSRRFPAVKFSQGPERESPAYPSGCGFPG